MEKKYTFEELIPIIRELKRKSKLRCSNSVGIDIQSYNSSLFGIEITLKTICLHWNNILFMEL